MILLHFFLEVIVWLLECLLEPLVGWVLWLLLSGVALVVATPFILLGALFGRDRYLTNVREGYASVLTVLGSIPGSPV